VTTRYNYLGLFRFQFLHEYEVFTMNIFGRNLYILILLSVPATNRLSTCGSIFEMHFFRVGL
jgi:hypothetical protein